MIDIQKKGALFVLVPLLILGLSVTACENTEELVDPTATTGTLVIDISPDDIDAPWELILPDGSTVGGNGDSALKGQMPGTYQLNFGQVPGYGSPTPRTQTLEAGDELRLTGTYVARNAPTGSVDIDPDPNELDAGWFLTVDGKLAAMGAGDSTVTDVTVGQVQLIWNPVEGWASPQPNPSVQTLADDSLITFAGTYTPRDDQDLGWIVVRPRPNGIQAPWTLTGADAAGGVGDEWLPGRPVGDYTLTWGEVAGYRTPKPSTGSLAPTDSLIFETTYELATGTITIDPSPNEIDAPWTLTSTQGASFDGSGDTTLRDIPVGQYTLIWEPVSGWVRPSPPDVTIFLGLDETRTISGTYEVQPPETGTVLIQAVPTTAPWLLTGPGFSTSGTGSAAFSESTPGDYTITWQPLDGWRMPNPVQRTRALPSGGSITFTGLYGNAESPALDPIAVPLVDGTEFDISGQRLGSHTLDISSAVGSTGWIEANASGTPVSGLSGATNWDAGFANNVPAYIDGSFSRSGQHSINAGIDRSADGDWQKPVTYYKAEGFDKMYASWWVYFDPEKIGEQVQWKIWYIGPTNHHSTCSSVTSTSSLSLNPLSFAYYQTGFVCCPSGCEQLTDNGDWSSVYCYQDLVPEPPYEPLFGNPWQYKYHNRAQTVSYHENHPALGQWVRMEIYVDSSDPDFSNGRYELYVTRENRERHHVDTWTNLRTHSSNCTYGGDGTEPWHYFGLHGYFDDNGGPFGDEELSLYYDDVYVQFGTKARVEIGNASDYASCTRREVQEPLSWNSDSIRIRVNRGDFSSGDSAYLFVIDGTGTPSPGTPITLE